YGYDAQGRLTTVDGQTVGYDGAGRVTSIAGRTSTYTSWSKPRQITRGTASLSMLYDADGERVRRRDSAGVDTVTLGSLYERKLSSNGTTRSITRRVSAGGRVVAQIVHTRTGVGTWTKATQWLHDDHLGSTVLLTGKNNTTVTQVAATSYDPWGRARSASNWTSWQTDADAAKTSIGFTGHRAELDHGFVDTGGRMYDPRLARFLSTDPLVDNPYAGRAYNRYAYVDNRPLRFTDPTGWSSSGGGTDEPGSSDSGASFYEGVIQWADQSLDEASAGLMNAFYARVSPAGAASMYMGLLESRIVAPVRALLNHGSETAKQAYENAKLILANPAEAARALGEGVLADAANVVTAYERAAEAAARGDIGGAVAIWADAAKSVVNLASLFGGGGAKWLRFTRAVGAAAAMVKINLLKAAGAWVWRQARKAAEKADDAAGAVGKRPSGFRKRTVQAAWDSAADGADNGKLCPTCGKSVAVPPGAGTRTSPRDLDMDHQPPWSARDQTGKSRKEVLDDYNAGTRLECITCNRGRGPRPAE
ncbi:MAG: RHS repeat-associated core domain-containing protein, partial [Nannocystaceae bacterium]